MDALRSPDTDHQLRLLSTAIDHIEDVVIITEANLDLPGPRIVFVNRRFTEVTGYTADEAIGQTPRILQGPETDRSLLNRLRQDLLQHSYFQGETINYRKDRSTYLIEWRVTPVYDDARTLRYWVSTQRDVTAVRALENTFQEKARLLERIISTTPDIVYLFDLRTQQALFAAGALFRILGYDPNSVVEMGSNVLLHLFHPDDLPIIAANIARLIDGPEDMLVEAEYRVRDSDGVWHIILTRAVPFTREAATTTVALGIATDISRLKQAELERLQLERALLQTQKLESLGIMASSVAHDFNNLLAAILAQIGVAETELYLDTATQKHFNEIARVVQRASELCQQMLAYAGKGHVVIQPTNLNSLIEDLQPLLLASIPRQVALQLALAPHLPHINADATQLRQVLLNLVINGAEAIGESEGTVTIRTAAEQVDRRYLADTYLDTPLQEGSYVIMEVSDTGRGMDEAVVSRIFDPFFTTKVTGRGLGLAAVFGIMRGHGGTLKVTSTLGKGTVFTLLFPYADDSTTQHIDTPAQQTATKQTTNEPGMILVVEHDDAVRSLIVRATKQFGFHALAFKNSHEAIEIFKSAPQSILCVIFDMQQGETTLQQLQEIRPDVPVLIINGDIMTQAMRTTGSETLMMLPKPFTIADLRERLHRVLSAQGR
jgi:PAS domain S-box-containing protein